MLLYEEETGKILNACFEVHKELGSGFLEGYKSKNKTTGWVFGGYLE